MSSNQDRLILASVIEQDQSRTLPPMRSLGLYPLRSKNMELIRAKDVYFMDRPLSILPSERCSKRNWSKNTQRKSLVYISIKELPNSSRPNAGSPLPRMSPSGRSRKTRPNSIAGAWRFRHLGSKKPSDLMSRLSSMLRQG